MERFINDENQFVVFRLGRETYALDISAVLEIITMQTITEVPGTDECIDGIINLRGRVIPVLNLHKKFGLSGDGITRATRIVVVEVDGCSIGMLVDEVSEVVNITRDSVEQPSEIMVGVDSEYLAGVAKVEGHLIIILELEKVLQKDEVQVVENIC
ncbi:MAG TPA: chemotaxis protein CheW [Desulfobacteria bacterium]|nr:chemotaxis protein CheW [Desulfobacteria bacterium]